MQRDQWASDYEAAKESANDTLAIIQVIARPLQRAAWLLHRGFVVPNRMPRRRSQERNLKHPEGGPEASRITAAARRKLGMLGSLLDALRTSLESTQYDKLCAIFFHLRGRRLPWCPGEKP